MNDAEVTPIDRPLMRSDLNEIRLIVWRISERQIVAQRNHVFVTAVCVACALVSIGCAVAGLR